MSWVLRRGMYLDGGHDEHDVDGGWCHLYLDGGHDEHVEHGV